MRKEKFIAENSVGWHRFSTCSTVSPGTLAAFGIVLADFTPHHHGDHAGLGYVADPARTDITAVTQYGVIIRNGKNLVKFMGNKQDGFIFQLEAFNNLIKFDNFMLRQRRRRLVEDHDLSVER